MTTDAWKALKRKRRRQVCRGIWRTFVLTLGLSLATAFVGHVIWFRSGWVELPLRCFDKRATRELSGEMTPKAAASFEAVLRAMYGDASAMRSSAGAVLVKPAVVYFDDDRRLLELTGLMAQTFAAAHGSPYHGTRWSQDCRVVQQHLMAGQRAELCEDAWEPHVYGVIDQSSWPWLTRFFRVRDAGPHVLNNLSSEALPPPAERPAHAAGSALLGNVNCGSSFHDQVYFEPILVVASFVIRIGQSLWPFD